MTHDDRAIAFIGGAFVACGVMLALVMLGEDIRKRMSNLTEGAKHEYR